MLTVEGLAKTYRIQKKGRFKEIEALRGVSFRAEAGEVIGVIGPSRAGKSTLLRIIAGVSLPTAGTVRGTGRVIPLLAPGAFFADENTGYRNAHETASLFGVPSEVVESKIEAMFEFAGLEEFRDVPVKRYSRGMYLRLAFAVALGLAPDIFVADDVLGVGDLDFQEKCIARLQELAAAGGLVLIVSHDPPTLARLCTRLVWLEKGELLRDGPPSDLLDDYSESSARLAADNVLHFARGADTNASCEFEGMELVDADGQPVKSTPSAARVGIRLHFKMLEDGHRPCCSVDLFTHGGLAFRSQSKPVALVPGSYSTTVWIPEAMLAESTYAVRGEVTLGERNQVRCTDLSFSVERALTDDDVTESWLSVFPGRVAPALEWRVESVERRSVDG